MQWQLPKSTTSLKIALLQKLGKLLGTLQKFRE